MRRHAIFKRKLDRIWYTNIEEFLEYDLPRYHKKLGILNKAEEAEKSSVSQEFLDNLPRVGRYIVVMEFTTKIDYWFTNKQLLIYRGLFLRSEQRFSFNKFESSLDFQVLSFELIEDYVWMV